jgi:AraC family transcriptional regulator, transcriptional activator of pobA
MPAACIGLYDSNMRPRVIQSWGLFGEVGELPDVLHCEPLVVRSALHGWELAPHRHARLHQLLLLRRGQGEAQLESGLMPLRAMSLVNVPAGQVHAFRFRPGSEGWVATLPDELLRTLLPPTASPTRVLAEATVVKADAALGQAFGRLASEFDSRGAARALVLRGLAAWLLGLAERALAGQARAGADGGAARAEPALLQRFEALVDQHYLERWPLTRYARALAVTPTHLSRVTRAATGLGASRLVEERLLREARRNLVFSTLSVKTIAYMLGYADPAHFSRSFARAAGESPRAFRLRLQQAAASSPGPGQAIALRR